MYLCPAGEKLTHHAIYNDKNGVRRHVYKQPRSACPHMRTPRPVCFEKASGQLEAIDYAHGRTTCDDCLQGQDEDRRSEADLQATVADCRVPARLDQAALRTLAISMPWTMESFHGSHLGLSQLQHHPLAQHSQQTRCRRSRVISPQAYSTALRRTRLDHFLAARPINTLAIRACVLPSNGRRTLPHRTGRHPLGKARFFHSFLTTKSDGQILFRILRNLGIAIECQKIFQNGDSWVIVHFCVPSVQLVIELDGKHHLLNKKYDAERGPIGWRMSTR